MKFVQIRALRSPPRTKKPCLLQGQLEAELKPGGAAVGVLSGLDWALVPELVGKIWENV